MQHGPGETSAEKAALGNSTCPQGNIISHIYNKEYT